MPLYVQDLTSPMQMLRDVMNLPPSSNSQQPCSVHHGDLSDAERCGETDAALASAANQCNNNQQHPMSTQQPRGQSLNAAEKQGRTCSRRDVSDKAWGSRLKDAYRRMLLEAQARHGRRIAQLQAQHQQELQAQVTVFMCSVLNMTYLLLRGAFQYHAVAVCIACCWTAGM